MRDLNREDVEALLGEPMMDWQWVVMDNIVNRPEAIGGITERAVEAMHISVEEELAHARAGEHEQAVRNEVVQPPDTQ